MARRYTVYLSGKMRGLPEFGFPVFDAAKKIIHRKRWKVVSPADMDRAVGFDGHDTGYDFDVEDALRRDFLAILQDCDGIVMIRENWRDSTGAPAELLVAQLTGKDLWEIDLETEEIYPLPDRVSVIIHEKYRKDGTVTVKRVVGRKIVEQEVRLHV